MAHFLLSTTCLLLLLAGSVASELAHAGSTCVPVEEVLDQGFLVDDTICPVSNNDLLSLEEAASDSAEGKLLVAFAYYSRNDESFYRWVEEAALHASTHPSGNSSIMQEAVHLTAFSHQYLLESTDSARSWYQLCLDMDESHKQCHIEAARLLGGVEEENATATAWLLSRKALNIYFSDLAAKGGSSFDLPCSVAIEGARSALIACRNGPEELYTPAKIFLAMHLVDIADAVCDETTLYNVFEEESIVSQLKDAVVDLFDEGGPPDRNVHCITTYPTTHEEIMDSNLLSYFHHNSHLCEFPQDDNFNVNTTIGDETAGNGNSGNTVSSVSVAVPEPQQVEEELDRLLILDNDQMPEDDIDTPHTSKTEIQLLLLLETHRLTGWW